MVKYKHLFLYFTYMKEGMGNKFDLSDLKAGAEEDRSLKKVVPEAPTDLSEMHGLLNEIQESKDVFQLADESEQVHELGSKDIKIISEEEANIAQALNDVRKAVAKKPPATPQAALNRPTPKLASISNIADARAKRDERQTAPIPAKKQSRVGKILSGLFGRKAA